MAVDEEPDTSRLEWDVFIPPARGGRWPWSSTLTSLAGLFALASVIGASCVWAVGHVESRLDKSTKADLQAIGVDTEQLEFDWDYRNVSVSGRLQRN